MIRIQTHLRSWVIALLVPALLAVSLGGAAQMGRAPQAELRDTTLALLGTDPAALCASGGLAADISGHCPICYLVRPVVFDRTLPPARKAPLILLADRGPTMPPPLPRPVRDPALGLRGPPSV